MRNTILGGFFVVALSCFYPQKAGKSQAKKENKIPIVTVVVNPNDKLADALQADITKTRARAEQALQEVIKALKKEIAQKNIEQKEVKPKIVYRIIYKNTIDTVYIHDTLYKKRNILQLFKN